MEAGGCVYSIMGDNLSVNQIKSYFTPHFIRVETFFLFFILFQTPNYP